MGKPMVPNAILLYAHSLMHLSAFLRSPSAENNMPVDYREKILKAFAVFEKNLMTEEYDDAQITAAKYALAAYIDEQVMYSCWSEKENWMRQPLQLEFFAENLAGEAFFERLNTLRASPVQHIDLLELYYVCMRLGFRGKYRVCDAEIFMGLMADLRGQVETIRGPVENALLVGEDNAVTAENILRKNLFFWILGSTVFGLILITYISCFVMMDSEANKAMDAIRIGAMRVGAIHESPFLK